MNRSVIHVTDLQQLDIRCHATHIPNVTEENLCPKGTSERHRFRHRYTYTCIHYINYVHPSVMYGVVPKSRNVMNMKNSFKSHSVSYFSCHAR